MQINLAIDRGFLDGSMQKEIAALLAVALRASRQ